MKHTFHHRLVNKPFRDTMMFLRMLYEKRALLFDAGEPEGLQAGEIMKISDLFISHTHIDHFIGFDAILRVLLKRPEPLRVYGPEGIIESVAHKLGGYTWNRIRQYPVKLDVFAIMDKNLQHARFHASEGFERQDMESVDFKGILLDEELFSVKAITLDHDIPSIAYSVEEPVHVNILKNVLEEMALPVGHWLKELKSAVRCGEPDRYTINAGKKVLSLGELRKAVSTTEGQKVTYVTDANPTPENIEKIIAFSQYATTLYCEACFLDIDSALAHERNHLTGAMAGAIALRAKAQKLIPMHFSTRYINAPCTPEEEALEVFRQGLDNQV